MLYAVYIDVLFFINFVINIWIFYISSIILCRKTRLFRLTLTSTFLAIYSCIMFFPQFSVLYTLLFKILALTLGSLIAFPTQKWRCIIKNTLTVFLIYTISGGIIYSLIFLTDFGFKTNAAVSNGEIYLNLSGLTLAAGFSVSMIFTLVFLSIHKNFRVKSMQLYNVKITYLSKAVSFVVFGDTGCNATDPMGGSPVMIIDKKIARKILPPDFFTNKEYAYNTRIIPYYTVSKDTHTMLGFVPDEIYIDNIKHDNLTIAISKTGLSQNNEYRGLINPLLIHERSEKNAEFFTT